MGKLIKSDFAGCALVRCFQTATLCLPTATVPVLTLPLVSQMFNFGGMPGGHSHGGMGGGGPPADTTKFYEDLGVAKDADANVIKKAYRKQAMQHHPDKGGDPEKFKEITRAYEVRVWCVCVSCASSASCASLPLSLCASNRLCCVCLCASALCSCLLPGIDATLNTTTLPLN